MLLLTPQHLKSGWVCPSHCCVCHQYMNIPFQVSNLIPFITPQLCYRNKCEYDLYLAIWYALLSLHPESRSLTTSWGNGSKPRCANHRTILGDVSYFLELKKWTNMCSRERDEGLSLPHLRDILGDPSPLWRKEQTFNALVEVIGLFCHLSLFTIH